jgi:hypothetical protein
MTTYNIYCDESGHLPNDAQPNMVLGAVWCPLERVGGYSQALRKLKKDYGLSPQLEVKWTKVSPAKVEFYLALVDFFFDQADLRFRSLVVPDKSKLDHAAFEQDHDTWYYKMYFSMLNMVITPIDRFRIYLDIKDTRSAEKTRKLHKVLCNNIYDFDSSVVERVQTVRSHEIELLQLADLLIGAMQHVGRGPMKNGAKDALVRRIQERSHYSLVKSTLPSEKKFNVFIWRAQEPNR